MRMPACCSAWAEGWLQMQVGEWSERVKGEQPAGAFLDIWRLTFQVCIAAHKPGYPLLNQGC